MKKRVLFLALVISCFGVFAQNSQQYNYNAVLNLNSADKAAIFTKAEGRVIKTSDCSQKGDFECGVIRPNHKFEEGDTSGNFFWVKDTTQPNFSYETGVKTMVFYNYLRGFYNDGGNKYLYPFQMQSLTCDNGFVFISAMDNANRRSGGKLLFGGEGKEKRFAYDSYVRWKESFSTAGVNSVQVSFYQLVQRFNYDKFYVEWSADNVNWDSIEINVRDIDLPTTQLSKGIMTVTLGESANNKETLYLRFRFSVATVNLDQAAEGYFWAIDDIVVKEGPENVAILAAKPNYALNFYHFLPKGLNVPNFSWFDYATSVGIQANNVTGEVELLGKGTKAISNKIDAMPLAIKERFYIDANNKDTSNHTTQLAKLSSNESGDYLVTSRIRNNEFEFKHDTMMVTVSAETDSVNRVWAIDNGQLAKSAKWLYSYDPDTKTRFDDQARVLATTFVLCVGYRADSLQTEDQYINGIQYVAGAGTVADATIFPLIYKDSVYFPNPQQFPDSAKVQSSMIFNNEGGFVKVKGDKIPAFSASTYYLEGSSLPTIDVKIKGGYALKKAKGQTSEVLLKACFRVGSTETPFFIGKDGVREGAFAKKTSFGPGIKGASQLISSGGSSQFYDITSAETPMIRLLIGPKAADSTDDTPGPGVSKMQGASFGLNIFPNPATSVANISYKLGTAGDVSLEVRDLMGRTIKTVTLGKKSVGESNYQLDVTNLVSGTYLVTLKVNGLYETKKVVVK